MANTNMKRAYGVEVKNDDVDKALEVFDRRVRKCKRLLKWKNKQQFTQPSKERRDERKQKERNARLEAADKQWWKREQHLENLG
jgi:ribosomal protein S21